MKSALWLLLLLRPASALEWRRDLGAALAESKAAGKPVLMDFHAPWCYSCYYMEKNVLAGEPFARTARGLILVDVDVDREEGRVLREKYRVPFLPTYVLLNAAGEAGRIVGEQTERDFLGRLESFMKAGPGEGSLESAVENLRRRLVDGDYDRAARETSRLPRQIKEALGKRKDWRAMAARLALRRALKVKDGSGIKYFKDLLRLEDSCELADDVAQSEALVDATPAAGREEILKEERAALEGLTTRRFFVGKPARCADFRTGIEDLAGVYGKLGMKDQRTELLKRAVALVQKEEPKIGEDRNLDDNLRVFLEAAGEDEKLRELFAKLIEAYPADYVYPYRCARYLAEHQKFAEALPFIEKAAGLSYGANRLAVTKYRAQIYARLGRKGEALALLSRDAKAGKASFPQEARQLEDMLDRLSK